MGVLRKKLKHILEILINVKAGRVKWGARKVYTGAALDRPGLKVITLNPKIGHDRHVCILTTENINVQNVVGSYQDILVTDRESP
jgi:hypothetical protein